MKPNLGDSPLGKQRRMHNTAGRIQRNHVEHLIRTSGHQRNGIGHGFFGRFQAGLFRRDTVFKIPTGQLGYERKEGGGQRPHALNCGQIGRVGFEDGSQRAKPCHQPVRDFIRVTARYCMEQGKLKHLMVGE